MSPSLQRLLRRLIGQGIGAFARVRVGTDELAVAHAA